MGWYQVYDIENNLVTEIELLEMQMPPEVVVIADVEYLYNKVKGIYEELPF